MRVQARGLRSFAKAMARRPTVVMSSLILVFYVAMALVPGLFTQLSPTTQDLRNAWLPPVWTGEGSPGHLLGTDNLGRDVLSRIVHGTPAALLVAVATFVGAGSVGLVMGLLSGFYGGKIDDFLTFWINIQLAFPFLLIAIVLLMFLPPGIGTIIMVIIFTTWVVYARVVRAVVLRIRELTYIEAARALGASDFWLLVKHVVPNVLAPLLTIGTLQMGRVVILEASLSFLGLGVPPPTPTWGGMLSDGRRYMLAAPWLATIPGLVLMLFVLSINILGDFLRDHFDPKLRI